MKQLSYSEMEQEIGGFEGVWGVDPEKVCTVGLSAILTYAISFTFVPIAGWACFGAALGIGIIADLACRGWWD